MQCYVTNVTAGEAEYPGRGLASMALLTADDGLKIREMRKLWDVEIIEEGAAEITITEERLETTRHERKLCSKTVSRESNKDFYRSFCQL